MIDHQSFQTAAAAWGHLGAGLQCFHADVVAEDHLEAAVQNFQTAAAVEEQSLEKVAEEAQIVVVAAAD